MSINSFFNTVSVSRYSRPITVTRENLRVEVGTFCVRFLKIFYSETTGKFTLAMYFYLGQE
jgi:hypothetical protein